MPTMPKHFDAAIERLLFRREWFQKFSTVINCIPIRKTGFSEVIGSWKIMLISPRIARCVFVTVSAGRGL